MIIYYEDASRKAFKILQKTNKYDKLLQVNLYFHQIVPLELWLPHTHIFKGINLKTDLIMF